MSFERERMAATLKGGGCSQRDNVTFLGAPAPSPAGDVGSCGESGQFGGQSGWVNKVGVEKWAIEGCGGEVMHVWQDLRCFQLGEAGRNGEMGRRPRRQGMWGRVEKVDSLAVHLGG